MPADDRPEDLANRELYNHLPTRRVTITFEADIACDRYAPSGGEDGYVQSLIETDALPMNLRVRNPRLVSTGPISDRVRYLDTLGNEVEPQDAES